MEVQILSNKLIKPSIPTPKHSSSYLLTPFDQISLKMHVPRVYFYSSTNSTTNIVDTLQLSLSKILSCFYPLAGRFSFDLQSVECLDQGVRFLEAKVDSSTLQQFLLNFYNDTSLLNQFVPWDVVKDFTSTETPLLVIQLTSFSCGGFAITFLVSHLLVDGFSYSTFINQWAAMSKSGQVTNAQHPSPFFNMGDIFPPRDNITSLVRTPPPSKRPINAKITMKIFVFDSASLSALKAKCWNGVGKPPSRVSMVTALVWRTLILVTQARNDRKLRASRLSFALSLRGGRTHPDLSIPDNAFGNLFVLAPVNFPGEESKLQLENLIKLSQETAKQTLSACAMAETADELFKVTLDLLNETRDPELCEGEVDDCFFTSLCRFPLYEADFGWGKPYWISSLNLGREMFTLVDTKCGTGIEARVCLNEVDMVRFESDPYIKNFASEPYWLFSI